MASAGPATEADCALVQPISPDRASEAADSRPPARAMTAPGAVMPSVRNRRYTVADQMASGAAAPKLRNPATWSSVWWART